MWILQQLVKEYTISNNDMLEWLPGAKSKMIDFTSSMMSLHLLGSLHDHVKLADISVDPIWCLPTVSSRSFTSNLNCFLVFGSNGGI